MLVHPLIRMLIHRPEAMAEHLGAYAELAAAEAAYAVARVRTQAIVGVASASLALLGLVLAGVALIVFASIPVAVMPHAWLLWVVPGLPIALAIGGALWLRGQSNDAPFQQLKAQMALDGALLDGARS